MKIYCWLRGLWYRYWCPNDPPISGHSGIQHKDGSITCVDCGFVLYDSKSDEWRV